MSILTRWGKAIETLNEEEMNACLHDDYKFTFTFCRKSPNKRRSYQMGNEWRYY